MTKEIIRSREQKKTYNAGSEVVKNATRSVALVLDDFTKNNKTDKHFHCKNGQNKIPTTGIPSTLNWMSSVPLSKRATRTKLSQSENVWHLIARSFGKKAASNKKFKIAKRLKYVSGQNRKKSPRIVSALSLKSSKWWWKCLKTANEILLVFVIEVVLKLRAGTFKILWNGVFTIQTSFHVP